MSEIDPIRVMIVDDHALVRSGLGAFLQIYDDLEFAAEAESGEEALQLCEKIQPDVVMMDLVMPGMDGTVATRAIRERWPHIQVIALTSFKDPDWVERALQAGAVGYLLKNVLADELAGGHVSHVDGVQTVRACLLESFEGRLGEHLAEARFPELAEASHSRCDDGHFAHLSPPRPAQSLTMIFSRSLAYWPYVT